MEMCRGVLGTCQLVPSLYALLIPFIAPFPPPAHEKLCAKSAGAWYSALQAVTHDDMKTIYVVHISESRAPLQTIPPPKVRKPLPVFPTSYKAASASGLKLPGKVRHARLRVLHLEVHVAIVKCSQHVHWTSHVVVD